MPKAEEYAEILENTGIVYNEGDFFRYQYTLDKETLACQEFVSVLCHTDGSEEE